MCVGRTAWCVICPAYMQLAYLPADPRAGCSQGEPFMAAVQVVPMPFFQEGFFDNW
jgi:hypothetical protein